MVTWPTENKFVNCQKDECQWKHAFAILQYKITPLSLYIYSFFYNEDVFTLLKQRYLHYI